MKFDIREVVNSDLVSNFEVAKDNLEDICTLNLRNYTATMLGSRCSSKFENGGMKSLLKSNLIYASFNGLFEGFIKEFISDNPFIVLQGIEVTESIVTSFRESFLSCVKSYKKTSGENEIKLSFYKFTVGAIKDATLRVISYKEDKKGGDTTIDKLLKMIAGEEYEAATEKYFDILLAYYEILEDLIRRGVKIVYDDGEEMPVEIPTVEEFRDMFQ